MTVENETKLLNTLEKFIETSNQKFDKVNETLTIILVNQTKLEGKIEALDVKIETLQKGQNKLETELKETRNKLESEMKDTKTEVSLLYKWVIGTLVVAAIGASNIFFKLFALLPKGQ